MKSLAAYALTIGALIALAAWWGVYKFHDCKKVGHSTLYCMLDIGK